MRRNFLRLTDYKTNSERNYRRTLAIRLCIVSELELKLKQSRPRHEQEVRKQAKNLRSF
jgi:hypothetical protein